MYKFILIPLVSALIGYFTNVVAIRMLFWPRQPVNLLFFQLQGLLPKRRAELASSMGKLVEEQLLSMDDLFEKINTPEVRDKISRQIITVVRDRLGEIMPRIVPAKLTQVIADGLEKLIRQEAENIIRKTFQSGQEYLNDEIKVSKIVEDKVNEFDLDQLEEMIRGVSSPELRAIEILGGVLGLIIGLVQDGILLLLG
ncbi:MAG: DUF445 family protein [Syntrophomonadaceae bacterium]|jgi:uncharacterized membrane protein YheB (UPF0754 family)|nr:DUF445 family protein [Syntrophomonadaceae bacterium]